MKLIHRVQIELNAYCHSQHAMVIISMYVCQLLMIVISLPAGTYMGPILWGQAWMHKYGIILEPNFQV